MIEVIDQVGNTVSLESAPKKIVSLVPSQTELLHYFGLENETVGITKFCIHPNNWFQTKDRVGGTKNLNLDKIRKLQPDLIIANKEENTKEQIEQLSAEFNVYISDVNILQDAYDMIKDVGMLCDKQQMAVDLIDEIQEGFAEIKQVSKRVLYFIWKDPYMVCGSNSFIDAVLKEIGLYNVISEPRYIELSAEQINKLQPDVVLLSTEPYPFKTEDVETLKTLTDADVKIVDGELFSWYGSRMLLMKDYFNRIF